MIKIRNSVFETNSSSTHTLVIPKKLMHEHEEVSGRVRGLTIREDATILTSKDTLDKLRYLYTAAINSSCYDLHDDWSDTPEDLFMDLLKQTFPNVTFIKDEDKESYIEDVDWLLQGEDFDEFIHSSDLIKNLILEGVITVYNRDSWNYVTYSRSADVERCIDYVEEVKAFIKEKTGEDPLVLSWCG